MSLAPRRGAGDSFACVPVVAHPQFPASDSPATVCQPSGLRDEFTDAVERVPTNIGAAGKGLPALPSFHQRAMRAPRPQMANGRWQMADGRWQMAECIISDCRFQSGRLGGFGYGGTAFGGGFGFEGGAVVGGDVAAGGVGEGFLGVDR